MHHSEIHLHFGHQVQLPTAEPVLVAVPSGLSTDKLRPLVATAKVLTTSGGKITNLRRVTFLVLDEAEM